MPRRFLAAEYRIEPLGSSHDRGDFFCGVSALDAYLQQQAAQDQKRKLAAVFVLTPNGKIVDGYYTLSAHSVLATQLPSELGRKLPRFPLPATLLGRMALRQSLQGQGLGEFLLLHSLERALHTSLQVASWAVLVDAKPDVRDFYLKHDFIPLLDKPDSLFLPMKTIEKMFET